MNHDVFMLNDDRSSYRNPCLFILMVTRGSFIILRSMVFTSSFLLLSISTHILDVYVHLTLSRYRRTRLRVSLISCTLYFYLTLTYYLL
jgi:hypothetical protein